MDGAPGTVTLLFTDVEGSTRLWELHGDRMLPVLEDHDRIVAAAVAGSGGSLQRERAEGDSSFAVFHDAASAVTAAIALQSGMRSHPWPEDLVIRTRAAVHTGGVAERDDAFYGAVVNRCVRLRSLGHGAQTILSGATADAVRHRLPDGASLADLGVHRLKDLAVPERVFELRHPALETGFPPLRSPDTVRHNLPSPLPGRFIGRSHEQRAVTKAFEHDRLVTLTGTGGVGKTRLALEVAWARVDSAEGHDGTWFVDLTPARMADDADHALAAAVGVREQPGRALRETVADALGDAAALLVLDNCEHLVDESGRLVRELLASCQNLRVLATSRETLGVAGERPRAVPGLPADAAMELFFERAELERGIDDDVVQEICVRLDGIPLAIEVAAARAQVLGSSAVGEGLVAALAEEAGRSVLEATLAWSHDLLDPPERSLFRRLGIFAGSFGLDAAEAVAADEQVPPSEVLDLLASLVERSLVHRSDGSYRQLVAVRDYAARQAVAAGEFEALVARHLQWFTSMAAAPRGERVVEVLDRLWLSRDDLFAALARPVPDDVAPLQVQLASSLEDLWYLRGAWNEGRRLLEAVLATGVGFRSHRGVGHRAAGTLAEQQGDLQGAEAHQLRAQDLFDEIVAELQAQASPLVPVFEEQLALTLLRRAELARLRGAYQESAAIARRARDLTGGTTATMAALAVGVAEHHQGRLAEADQWLELSLREADAEGNQQLAATCLRALGVVALVGGEVRTAADRLRRALELSRSLGDDAGTAACVYNLAVIAAVTGRPGAADLLEEALSLQQKLGDRRGEADSVELLGDLAFGLDRDAARRHYTEALAFRQAIGLRADAAFGLLRLAAVDEADGDLASAVASATDASATFRELGDERGVAQAMAALARLQARSGAAAEAATALREAARACRVMDARLERVELYTAGAWLALTRGQPQASAALLGHAAALRDLIGIIPIGPQRLQAEAAAAAISAALTPEEVGTAFSAAAAGGSDGDRLLEEVAAM